MASKSRWLVRVQRFSGFFQVEGVVEPTGQHAAAQGADPVHAVISPMLRGQGWPEAARRIHRRAGERPAHQNIHSDGKADGETCNLADRKSTRLNSSHVRISYAVFCLKKNN